MQICPKCEKTYEDEAKICRTCGSILDVYLDLERAQKPIPEATQDPGEELLTIADAIDEPDWVCPQCKKNVPGTFDFCWNCYAGRDGRIDPEFAESAAADKKANQEELVEEIENHKQEDMKAEPIVVESPSQESPERVCLRCGSDKLIRGVRVLDHGEGGTGDLRVVIYGDPEALFFKDSMYGKLFADICGKCGHVELIVQNPASLYDHYQYSRQ